MDTLASKSGLRAAAGGEARILCHAFLQALNFGEQSAIESQISNILSIGTTSEADARAGFADTFTASMETEKKHVVS